MDNLLVSVVLIVVKFQNILVVKDIENLEGNSPTPAFINERLADAEIQPLERRDSPGVCFAVDWDMMKLTRCGMGFKLCTDYRRVWISGPILPLRTNLPCRCEFVACREHGDMGPIK